MESQRIQKANFRNVVYLSTCFMVLFTAYSSSQNLMTQIYAQLGYSNLGKLCLFCIFGFLAIMSPIASHFVKKIPAKTGIICGGITQVLVPLAGLLTTSCEKFHIEGGHCSPTVIVMMNVLFASLLGFGGAFLWLCQSTYVNECSTEKTKGIFNGTFWSIFQSSQIWSAGLASYILGKTDQFTFYSFLLCFGFAAIVMLMFIKPPIQAEVRAQPAQAENETLTQAMHKFIQVLGEKECRFLYCALFFMGIAIGSYINFLGTAVTMTSTTDNVNEINRSIGVVFLVLACGEVGAGLSVGKLADKYDKLKIYNLTMIINEAALILTTLACLSRSYYIAIIAGLLWGYGDTAMNTISNAVIGSYFNGSVALFSAYRFFQGGGIMFACLLNMIVPKEVPLLYIMCIAGCLLALHMLYQKYLPKQTKGMGEFLISHEKKMANELANF